jgi:hypothetical protein
MGRADSGRKVEVPRERDVVQRRRIEMMYSPISWMKFISFGFSKLHHYRESHYDSACKSKRLLNQIDGAEFHVTDSKREWSLISGSQE